MNIDINCDLGESYGAYRLGNDEEILQYVTSANIACGFHAGDPGTMRKTVELALKKDIGIGAHPGLQDLAGFGRREMNITPREAYELVIYQIGALYAFVKAEGGSLQHVKPHGALYNMAAKSEILSEAIAEAVYKVNPELILFGLAGGELIKAGKKIGLQSANEVFADRSYQIDGSLTSRQMPNAVIKDPKEAIAQAVRMVKDEKVRSLQGVDVSINADTVCIHGDGIHAVKFARLISQTFMQSNIKVNKVKDFLL